MTHRTKNMLLLLPLCAVLLLTGFTSSFEKSYQDAEALLAQGDYEAASARFRELGSYEEASRLLMYSRAAAAAESGDYETARRNRPQGLFRTGQLSGCAGDAALL